MKNGIYKVIVSTTTRLIPIRNASCVAVSQQQQRATVNIKKNGFFFYYGILAFAMLGNVLFPIINKNDNRDDNNGDDIDKGKNNSIHNNHKATNMFSPSAVWSLKYNSSSLLPPLQIIPPTIMVSSCESSSHTTEKAATVAATSSLSSASVICPSYGCPLTTQDIWNSTVRQALEALREKSKDKLSPPPRTQDMPIKLKSSGDKLKATLTLGGFKGGEIEDQINQDRGLVVSPFLFDSDATEMQQSNNNNNQSQLMGIFDGHADYGERVAECCVTELPKLLADKLSKRLRTGMEQEEYDSVAKKALEETFVELDELCGTDGAHGGSTASVILQLGSRLFVANTGDSRSFICVHHSATGYTNIVYTTADHKPSVPEEKARVESMGGEVWQPSYGQGSARVVFRDPLSGIETGLAMSRSIGDRDISELGIIPDPHVDIIDIEKLVNKEIIKTIYENEQITLLPPLIEEKPVDDVHIFAVSASDGMVDILTPRSIASYLVSSLCEEKGEHLLTACERLISMAADGWEHASGDGKYRDDIAISVSKIRSPPKHTTACK